MPISRLIRVLILLLAALPQLQGELPQRLQVVFVTFIPIAETRIAQEET